MEVHSSTFIKDERADMEFPKYYHQIEKIRLFDPLAEVLGSCNEGIIEFSFSDVVSFAGHGCPTVGGAYLMTLMGLKLLYKNLIPIRGMIEVHMGQAKDSGTTGVVAAVAGFILGASDEGGFKGLAGNYFRNNLIKFSQDFKGHMRLVRIDTGESVTLEYHPEIVPGNQLTGILLEKILKNVATIEEKKEFQTIWNQRLEKIMVNEISNPNLIITR